MLYLPFAMNNVLHAVWIPGELAASGELFIWGESSGNRQRAAGELIHAFKVLSHMEGLGVRLNANAQRMRTVRLVLPALAGRLVPFARLVAPLKPSRRRIAPSDAPAGAVEPSVAELALFQVEGIALNAAETLKSLLQLPFTPASVRLGPGLLFWREAALLLAQLLQNGHYVPSTTEAGHGRWQLLWRDEAWRARREALVQAMPPAVLTLAAPLPQPPALFENFLNDLTHAFVAEAHAPTKTPLTANPHMLRPADAWWLGLFPRHAYNPNLPVFNTTEQAAFAGQVQAWIEPLSAYLASDWHVVFRLEPPQADPNAPWRLSFHVQPKSQPEVLWAAREVWEAAPSVSLLAVLRAGLGHAARLYPPLHSILREPAPEALELDVAAAAEFLERYASLLTAQGFGVWVPQGWKARVRPLTTRLNLSQATEGSGLLGMESLVNFNWQLAVGDHTLSPEEFATLAQTKTSLVQVRGEWVQVDPNQVQAALRLVQRHQKNKGRLTLREALGLALLEEPGTEWEGLQIETVALDPWMEGLRNRLKGHQPLHILSQPGLFQGVLRPYQVNGLSWLAFMRDYGLGACLADDMGLGKTIQVLALLARDLEQGHLSNPVLLVCPTTVVNNWVRESERFVPGLRCYAHHGPQRAKGADFETIARQHHLVITSYALLPRDQDFIEGVPWHGVVLDEAHNIKNPSTKQAQSVRRLRAGFRLALTGTPVENRLQDLWSIMHFINPGYLGSTDAFQRRFATPIERGLNTQAAPSLRAITGPFILRRLKTDQSIIRDLPPKNEMKEYCGLTKEQAALYRAVVQESLRQINEAAGIQRRGIILATLTKLKQVCNHPRHLLGDNSPLHGRSGKLTRLMEMLEQALAEDDRVLIFTQYAEMGAILHDHLNQQVGETLYLYGGTPATTRSALIDRFQAGEARVFVLSLKAGGAGINLTRANRVFHYDRWWNPAVENQATDRAFRIGQTQMVQVHKFICRGTLEERVDELIEQKVRLADQIVGSGESWLTDLNTEQLRDLLTLRREALDD